MVVSVRLLRRSGASISSSSRTTKSEGFDMGCSGRKKSKVIGKHSKWFYIHRDRGTLKNYTQSGRRKKGASRKK